jgi:hypothetical protein
MLVPNGTVKFVYDNPTFGGDKRPLFSMVTANPVEGFHLGQIADITGEGNTFAIEDMRFDCRTDRIITISFSKCAVRRQQQLCWIL